MEGREGIAEGREGTAEGRPGGLSPIVSKAVGFQALYCEPGEAFKSCHAIALAIACVRLPTSSLALMLRA